jgi:Zn-dependent membrane protease YugP
VVATLPVEVAVVRVAGHDVEDVEIVDHGDAAEAEQVLAGTAVAGTAALPTPDVRESVLDRDAFAQHG